MEEKLEELQRKLADEEAERKEMAESFTQKADEQSVQREELVQVCIIVQWSGGGSVVG